MRNFLGLGLGLGLGALLVGCASSTTPPPTTTAANNNTTPIHVAIQNDGAMTLDGKKVDSAAALTAQTREAVRMRPNVKVVIDAEREVAFQNVMGAVERVRAGGVQDVTFGAMLASTSSTTTNTAAPVMSKGPTPEPHASVAVGTKWDCAFPSPAERKGKDEANVLVVVHVETDGKPLSVDVLQDPGGGFGAAATKCALEKAYQSPRDVNGRPIRSTTFPFFIHFVMH
jgi:biopolymer transport protein ExbD